MTAQVATANRLRDGLVVFLAADGAWSTALASARVAHTPDEAGSLLAAAERSAAEQEVVAPYLIDVADDGGRLRPVRFREVIRAQGPSILDQAPPRADAVGG
jgi:hypothetical protein